MPLIVLLCLSWIFGIWLAAQVSPAGFAWPAWLAMPVLTGGGLLLLKARRLGGRTVWWGLAAVTALGLGGLRWQAAQPVFDQRFLASHNDQGPVTLEGVVWDLPDVRDARTNLRLRVDTLHLWDGADPIEVRGLALVYAPRFSDSRLAATGDGEFRYGDRVRVTGALETPPEFDDFSYKDYLARQGVHSQVRLAQVTFIDERQGQLIWQALFDLKRRALSVLAQIFPEPHASLLAGILLGVESGIPADMQAAFAATGTSHIVAISGFNIAIIAGLFAVLANRLFGARRGLWIAIVGVAAYTVLAGASASVVRAAIMGSLALVAQQVGRRGAGLNTLAAAAGLMTLANPLTLWDVGFQLSAAATLGLIVYAEPLQLGFGRLLARFTSAQTAQRVTAAMGESLLLTLAAQLTTLPLMIYYFRSISLISLLANVAILPAQPAVMILAGLALLLGLAWLPLGKLAAWAAWPFSAYTLAGR